MPHFIHSSVDGHVGCLRLLAIVNSAAANIGGQVTVIPFYNCPHLAVWWATLVEMKRVRWHRGGPSPPPSPRTSAQVPAGRTTAQSPTQQHAQW